jgi:hypothetical protein
VSEHAVVPVGCGGLHPRARCTCICVPAQVCLTDRSPVCAVGVVAGSGLAGLHLLFWPPVGAGLSCCIVPMLYQGKGHHCVKHAPTQVLAGLV